MIGEFPWSLVLPGEGRTGNDVVLVEATQLAAGAALIVPGSVSDLIAEPADLQFHDLLEPKITDFLQDFVSPLDFG